MKGGEKEIGEGRVAAEVGIKTGIEAEKQGIVYLQEYEGVGNHPVVEGTTEAVVEKKRNNIHSNIVQTNPEVEKKMVQ